MKVGFISLGCAKNQVNCEQMIWQTYEAGHEVALGAEGCDVAVVNTCGFLQEARDEALSEIDKLAELKRQGRLGKIIVTGCMAQWSEVQTTRSVSGTGASISPNRVGRSPAAAASITEAMSS